MCAHQCSVLFCHPIYSGRQSTCFGLDASARVTQELFDDIFYSFLALYLPSALLAFLFIAWRVQRFLFLVDLFKSNFVALTFPFP